jgi:hypothetical protein
MWIFGKKEQAITPDQIEILIHREAAYFGEHGRMLATNKQLGVVEKEVIFCAKGFTTPPALNHRMFAHIWNSFLEEGWIPLEMVSYGTVIEKQVGSEDDDQNGHVVEQGRGAAKLALADNPSRAQATGTQRTGFPLDGAFDRVEVPPFMRKEKQNGEGFESAGFAAAAPAAG